MRLVMGGESLEGPLTGIGQYTYHLAKEMLANPNIEDFKFLAHGRLREPEILMAACSNRVSEVNAPGNKPSIPNQLLGKARSIAAKSSLAVELYGRLIPRLERHSLRYYENSDLYHSPNYMLPEFPGKTVVSILDLSTYRYPEHHPEARVRFVNGHIERAVKSADHIVTISNFVKSEIMERFNVPESRITVTYLGADESFHPMPENLFGEQARTLGLAYKGYFLFTSSIEPRKNLDRLLDAYLAYREGTKDHPLPLIVTGMPGWKSQHTHERLQQLQSEGAIRYLGYVDQRVLPILVAGARAVLYPSLYEGFGLPVLEAMQCGTATMTSRDTSMAEICGDAALLINAIDTEEMTNAIASLANQPENITLLVSKGLENAKEFSWGRCANQTLRAYQAA
jgi:O-antigen biosynthesis alpha-1,3-mannosyltransferase